MQRKQSLRVATRIFIALVAALNLVPTAAGTPKFRVLHTFHRMDGAGPVSLVFDSSGNLYGTTGSGGTSKACSGGCGTVFKLAPDGKGGWTETVLHSFQQTDGTGPIAVTFDSAGNLYGATAFGGLMNQYCAPYGCGTIFKLTPNNGQWSLTTLYAFGSSRNDAATPQAGVALDTAGNLFGTSPFGGTYGWGAVFELMPDGHGNWVETLIHSFRPKTSGGVQPYGGMVLDGIGNLYGTTYRGGTGLHSLGVVFELSPGKGGQWTESVLHSFRGSDGGNPKAGVILDPTGNLYGAAQGGKNNLGVVFKLTPGANGKWTETRLHSFKGQDGEGPQAPLTLDVAGNLYGTTYFGGAGSVGVVFKLTPNGSKWSEGVLHSFHARNDGAYPASVVILDSAGNIYGTAPQFGDPKCKCGVAFEITP